MLDGVGVGTVPGEHLATVVVGVALVRERIGRELAVHVLANPRLHPGGGGGIDGATLAVVSIVVASGRACFVRGHDRRYPRAIAVNHRQPARRRPDGNQQEGDVVHELSLCGAVEATVIRHAADRPVRLVRVRIGHLRQVVPDTLAWYWEMQTEGGPLAGSALAVDEVPAIVRCRACGVDTTLTVPILLCGSCDGADVELVSGEEFDIVSIELDPGAVPRPGGHDAGASCPGLTP